MLTELFGSMENSMPPYFYRVARDWVKYFSGCLDRFPEREMSNPFHIYEMVVRYEPFWALDLIVATLELDKRGDSVPILIDGPLTEFINTHGQVYLDDIILRIKENVLLKKAMKRVVRIDIDDHSWLKICEAFLSE